MAAAESEAQRRQREAAPFVVALTQHALETADTAQLAELIEGFLDSDDQAMQDAFVMGLVRSSRELSGAEARDGRLRSFEPRAGGDDCVCSRP